MDIFVIAEFVYLLVIDLAFLFALLILMLPLGIWRQSAFAVMKRNFTGYFSNPTGYVFLCLFVLLTSFAAFWPHEFFTTNLANFDQLNRFLPFIMLIFIPAITMSLWAEERRQGTDELLLTLPAHDFDIVIGKYFAAVFVFTLSLLFSQLCNYAVLLAMTGGELDTLLLFSTYLGYWFMGIAMLAVGMVASFLTNNLTVGFIFGAAFNAPLAFFSRADLIVSDSAWIRRLFEWSLLQRFEPFGRGLISPSAICYFLGIVVLGIFFSLVLIGRRHWAGGRDGRSMFWHYVLRGAFLAATVVAAVLVVQHSPLNQARVDISSGKVSTLSDTSRQVLTDLAAEKPPEGEKSAPVINVDAFVSGNLPTEYFQASYNLVNLLREFDVLGGNRVQVNLQQGIQPFSEEAILAEKRFGIRPRKVVSSSRGAIREEDTIFGLAVSSGRQRIVMPFIPYGAPVEYELIRAIRSVAHPERKKLGVIQTDASVMGAMLQMPGEDGQPQRVQLPMLRMIGELRKEYDVESVDASSPVPVWLEDENGRPVRRRYDVMLVVQPSKMTAGEMANLLELVRLGQPLLVFEDALTEPEAFPTIYGTFFPRRLNRLGSEPADIGQLLSLLQLDVDRQKADGLWYPWLLYKDAAANPYRRDTELSEPERLIIRAGEVEDLPKFAPDHPATRGITEIGMDYATPVVPLPDAKLEFTELVNSGNWGRINTRDFIRLPPENRDAVREAPRRAWPLVAHIRGNRQKDDFAAPDITVADDQRANVIWVCDVDFLSNRYAALAEYPIQNGIEYRFQNVALLQNLVDYLAGNELWLSLRNRRQRQSTLRVVEQTVDAAMDEVYVATQEFEKKKIESENKLTADVEKELGPLQRELERMDKEGIRNEEFDLKRQTYEARAREQAQRIQSQMEQLDNARTEELRAIQLRAELKIQETQRNFKLAAVIIPPIPPLLMGLIVFTRRRLREREGISKARRLK